MGCQVGIINDVGTFAKTVQDIFFETNDILWMCDLNSGSLWANTKFEDITQYKENERIDNIFKFMQILHPGDEKAFINQITKKKKNPDSVLSIELRIVCKNKEIRRFVLRARHVNQRLVQNPLTDSILFAGGMTDITEGHKKESMLNQLAYYDSLTGLPNRSMFAYKTSIIINENILDTTKCAVVSLDLDNFKNINNLYGHYIGDDVLKKISHLISEKFPSIDLISRPGGDELLLLFSKVEDVLHIEKCIMGILKNIRKPMMVRDNEIRLTCSAGIAIFPEDGDNAEDLIKNSDTALHKAKAEGKNRFSFFQQSFIANILKHTEMEKNIRHAISNNEFYLVYQPKVDIATKKAVGAEALLRWNSTVYGNISPMEFIPIAEETGLIIELGRFVLHEACAQCKEWIDMGLNPVPISVNISSVQLRNEKFNTMIYSVLEKTSLPNEFLELEVTESILVENFDCVFESLTELRSNGIRIALDDFGTGYSSLNYLKMLPLDVLKIDKSFIKNVEKNDAEKAIATAIITLAHALNLEVVAEGVETIEQYKYLEKIGCNTIQGYYMGRPMMSDVFREQWLKNAVLKRRVIL